MEHQSTNLFDLQIDGQSSSFLSDAARWSKFLAIIGFVMCGLLVVAGIFAGSVMGIMMNSQMGAAGGVGGAVFTVVFLFFALLYFFPCLYLFNFASKMQLALRTNDQAQLNASFKNLKSCMRYMGIFTIIILSFYILGIVASVLTAGFR
jgi:hypothetical protein